MMYKTHLVIALVLGLLIAEWLNPTKPLLFLGILCLASLIPDIDMPKSKIGKRAGIFSKIINITLGHRGVMHSLYIPLVVFVVFLGLGFPLFGFAFLIGYSIHVLSDALTKEGVNLFYPFLSVRGFISTNGIWEKIIFFVLLGVLIWKISSYLS